MKKINMASTDNPEGLIALVNSLPADFTESEYSIVFPSTYLYSSTFPVLAAWSKRAPDGTRILLDMSACQESAKRLVENVGLKDIVEADLESPQRMVRGTTNVPLQPIVIGRSTEEVLDRVYHMVDDWVGYQRDTKAFRTILSELAENILVHSESATPGYVIGRVQHTGQGDKCEITLADSGIGIYKSYIEGTNEAVKQRIKNGASAIQIAVDGLNTSKPRDISPGGRSYFGYGLYTVKRLMEINRGRMTVISGNEFVTINYYQTRVGRLSTPWQGTIVALVIELANPLPLDNVYEEEVDRLVPHKPGTIAEMRVISPTPTAPVAEVGANELTKNQEQPAKEQTARSEESPNKEQPERMTLVVRNFATKLLARETGLAIRAELATLLVDGAVVEVDLDGVEDITPSVADECFGKLAARLGDQKFRTRIVFRGGTPLLHRLIEFVVLTRLNSQLQVSDNTYTA